MALVSRGGTSVALRCDYSQCLSVRVIDGVMLDLARLSMRDKPRPPAGWLSILVEGATKTEARDYCSTRHAAIDLAKILAVCS